VCPFGESNHIYLGNNSAAVMSGSTKKFSWEEIKKHNGRKDCWIVLRGKVYNVTSFLDEVHTYTVTWKAERDHSALDC